MKVMNPGESLLKNDGFVQFSLIANILDKLYKAGIIQQ